MTARLILVLLAAAVLAGLWYVGACVVYPLHRCRRCKGEGKHRNATGRAWRLCKRCKGSGSAVRLGRRLYDRIGTAHQRAKKADR